MQVVVAFDPGGTTGIAVAKKNGSTEWDWEHYELGPKLHHEKLWNAIKYLRVMTHPNLILTVVCEMYDRRHNDAAELISVEYIGILRLWCETHGVRFVPQSPSEVKSFWTDDKLRYLKLFFPTDDGHANDATRHALRFISQYDKQYIYELRGMTYASSV